MAKSGNNRGVKRRVLPYAFLALAATAAAGGFALNRLLDRPGETALNLVPANALGAVSLDLVPAPDQIVAFKSIDDMIASSGAKLPVGKDGSGLIGSMLGSMAGDEAVKPIFDQVDRSAALAMIPKKDGQTDGAEPVALLPIKDPASIEKILAKGKVQTIDGMPVVTFHGNSDIFFSLQGNVLVASTQGWPVAAVAKVAKGEAKSITSDAAFMSARSKALPSANLLVLVSPAVAKGEDWLVGSMTIRDTGMEVAVSGQANDPEIMKAGSLTPIGSSLLAALPRGAYGFIATAQPGPAVALAGKELDEPSKEFNKEMELDLKNDVLPALGGNVAIGLYPGVTTEGGLDILVSIDEANGADPATLAKKLEKTLDGKMEEGGKAQEWKVEGHTADGTMMSRLADEPVEEMQKALAGVEKSFFKPLSLSKGKTVAWATVGRSVLLATSQPLLDRAVASRKAPSAATGLSGDSALGARPAEAADGQFALAISMRRLAEGIRNTVDASHMSVDTAKTYRKALSLYDTTTEPLAIRAKMGADGRYSGYVSIPFDWSKLPGLFK